MTELKINDFAREVHENAVAHGWWEDPPDFPVVAALIHSEISEALEEYRKGAPLIHGCCNIEGARCEFRELCEAHGELQPSSSCKPEGLAVELADAMLRILDYLAREGVDIESVLRGKHAYNQTRSWRHGGKAV